jgi:hypothetical protein
VGEIQCGAEQFVAVLHHLASPAVHGRIHHDIRAGGHQQVGTRRQVVLIDQVALQVKHRTLFETGAHLVHAHDADVGAGIHRPGRQVVVERQMSAPRLIDNQRLTAFMAHSGDASEVGASAIWAGTDNQRPGGVGMAFPCVLDLLG